MTPAKISKSALLDLVKGWRWRELRGALTGKAPLEHRDKRGRSWLHICCGVDARKHRLDERDGLKTARLLIDAGLDPHAGAFFEENFAATPLWYAIAHGRNLSLAKYLLGLGANPDWRDAKGRTPLHILLKKGSAPDALAMLIEHGARLDIPDRDGQTAAAILGRKRQPAYRRLAQRAAAA